MKVMGPRQLKSLEVSLRIENFWTCDGPTYESERNGDPGPIRTADLRFRKPMLYPSELRGHMFRQQLVEVGVILVSPSFKC